MKTCKIEGCGGKAHDIGLCGKHATRWRKTGTTDPSPVAPAPAVDRFWRKVQKSDTCWLWLAGKDHKGYGIFGPGGGGKHVRASRFSYELHKGKIPEGLKVLHTCDTPACVNPEHLFVGTDQDNMDDRRAKNRTAIGVRVGSSRLKEFDVLEIRKSALSSHKLGKIYGVSHSTIRNAKLGLTWKHV